MFYLLWICRKDLLEEGAWNITLIPGCRLEFSVVERGIQSLKKKMVHCLRGAVCQLQFLKRKWQEFYHPGLARAGYGYNVKTACEFNQDFMGIAFLQNVNCIYNL